MQVRAEGREAVQEALCLVDVCGVLPGSPEKVKSRAMPAQICTYISEDRAETTR